MRIRNVQIGQALGLTGRGQKLAAGLADLGVPGYHADGGISALSNAGQQPAAASLQGLEELPYDLQGLVTDVGQLTDWIENNALPDALVEWVARNVIETEATIFATNDDLYATLLSLQTAGESEHAQEIREIQQKQNESRQNFVEHNTFKFWCFIVPQLRDALKGKVKPSYISLLAANDQRIAQFVAEHATDTIAARRAEGVMLDGLGLVPVVGAGAAAVFIAGAIVLYAALHDGSLVLREWSANARHNKVTDLVASGKLTGAEAAAIEGEVTKQTEANKPPDSADPFTMITKVAMWGGIALVVFLVGPPIISVLTAKMVAKAAS